MLTVWYFNRAIELLIVGQIPSAYVEIHSLLEQASIKFFNNKMKVKDNQKIIYSLIERKTLKELSPLYYENGTFNKLELTFIKRLINIRNGIAHKNLVLLEKHIGKSSNEILSLDEYDNLNFSEKECIQSLSKAIHLCVVLFKAKRSKNDDVSKVIDD